MASFVPIPGSPIPFESPPVSPRGAVGSPVPSGRVTPRDLKLWGVFKRKVGSLDTPSSNSGYTEFKGKVVLILGTFLEKSSFEGDELAAQVIADFSGKSTGEFADKYFPVCKFEVSGFRSSPFLEVVTDIFVGDEFALVPSLVKAERSSLADKIAEQSEHVASIKDELLRTLILRKKTRNVSQQEDNFDAHVMEVSELATFIKEMEGAYQAPKRFQVLVRTGVHYCALDFEINKEGTNCFVMDAAEDPSVDGIIEQLRKAEVHFAYQAKMPDSIKNKDGEKITLQVDRRSCAFMAYEHMVQSSKVPDLFKRLNDLKEGISPGQVGEISWLELPPELVKNAQSLTFFDAYFKANPKAKDHEMPNGKDFGDYHKSGLRELETDKGTKVRNVRLEVKARKLAEKAQRFVVELSEQKLADAVSICPTRVIHRRREEATKAAGRISR